MQDPQQETSLEFLPGLYLELCPIVCVHDKQKCWLQRLAFRSPISVTADKST